jgi:hypothetical protein
VATAQERFAAMLRDDVAPALRGLGLKGSGQAYTLPSETHWALIGFQKFSWSNADRVEFTLNLTVARKDEWAAAYEERPHIGARPKPNVGGGPAWSERIGGLMPDGDEVRWAVEVDEAVEPVVGDVVGAIRDHALPAMRERMR